MIRGFRCSKSSLAKAAGAEAAVQQTGEKWHGRCGAKHICKSKCTKHHNRGAIFEVPMFKNCTPLWRKAHLEVKMQKKLTVSEHFLKFRCPKIARRCGAKHIYKPKCSKHLSAGPILEVAIRQNCTPLWREAHF